MTKLTENIYIRDAGKLPPKDRKCMVICASAEMLSPEAYEKIYKRMHKNILDSVCILLWGDSSYKVAAYYYIRRVGVDAVKKVCEYIKYKAGVDVIISEGDQLSIAINNIKRIKKVHFEN